RIAQYAEFLSFNRNTDKISVEGNFDYYSADNITNNDFTRENVARLFEDVRKECNCEDLPERTVKEKFYRELPLKQNPAYGDTRVNMDLSVVKVATNIYYRDQDVLQGVRWSEALDMVFKSNWEQDKTLKFQYFASPYGYMRHFPAVKWSDERYAMTYDPRTRSWYTEAMTSPKDIIILLDRSGSVYKRKRIIAAQIVNNILDTLNDNDFANEENLRLLRESLDTYDSRFAANVSIALEKAFQILADFRLIKKNSSQCNQAIMLITEAVYYDSKNIFQEHNWQNNTPVRVFTYQLETDIEDAKILEFMACSNKGYYVNISLMEEIREKILPYLNVMSRPVNFKRKQEPIWSYLYIDLADRRYTNWLWRKIEGNRQREVFLDHAKREFMRNHKMLTSENHFLLQETHDYEKYAIRQKFDYMTTVSLPVYGRRKEDIDLIGVAGIDVPIKLLYSLIPHHILGVNGYAFIVTNNGYILMHPGHRPEFENITKPTFNRVDLLEVEILEDSSEPRLFGKPIVQFREDIVQKPMGEVALNIKFALDDMRTLYSPLFYLTQKQQCGSKTKLVKKTIDNVFLSTHSGLTRWKIFNLQVKEKHYDDKGERENLWGKRSIDEDWYKRAVEESINKEGKEEDLFIYSAPFETSGYEYDNMITSTSAIFVNAKGKKTPVAVVGLQFNYRTMNQIYKNITTKNPLCINKNKPCYTCDSVDLTCFILDNNAYVVLSDEIEYTGRYIGDIKPEIMYHLVKNGVYQEIRMFDYQAICQKPPKAKIKNAASSTVSIFRKIVENLLQVTNWTLATILFLVTSIIGGPDYESSKNETLAYERLEINKTVPTPCDQQMWLFTLNETFDSVGSFTKTNLQCSW
ncbi:voltage-dependent calcium channel subunit alpha-2/delta-3-like, partial [Asbolus verrucosus]